MKFFFVVSVALFALGTSFEQEVNEMGQPSYGVDVSFPVHYSKVSANYNNDRNSDMPFQPLGNRQKFYDEFIAGCKEFYGRKGNRCDITEQDRLEMSVRQPQSMQNYTDTGFKKIRAPEAVMKLLSDYWEKHKDKKNSENWPAGNTYTNHWKAPTYMVSVEDTGLRGGGVGLKNKIWDAARSTIEEWTGMEQKPVSMYGIRVYTEGAVLAPHADRMPLISSAIVNVAQDVEEDWPLEVYGRDGLAYNVTMKPGDMVLYESHSLIHGRPFELKGKYYANIFIHFEPVTPLGEARTSRRVQGNSGEMPQYILRGSPEEAKWLRENSNRNAPAAAATPLPEAAQAAATGDVRTLVQLASRSKSSLHEKDSNGWQPIHEAARSGHLDVLELLIKHGAEVNERTNFGRGQTPLTLAVDSHGEDHPVVEYLISVGAVESDEL